jgi:hypothetical protein
MSELLFSKLGITADELTELTEEKAIELHQRIQNNIKTSILDSEDFYKNLDEAKISSEFKNKYLGEGTAKIAGMARKALDREFNLTEDDKSTFAEEDLKNIDKYISKVKSIHNTKISSGNKDIDALQNENLSLKQKISEYDSKINDLQTKFDSDLTEKLTAQNIETLTLIETSKLQENIVGQASALFKLVYPNIQSKYAIIIDNGVPSLRKKDNIAFKVEVEVNGTKQHMTIDKAIEQELRAIGVWRDSNSNPQPSNKIVVTGDFGNKQELPDAIRKKIEEEKAFMGR